MNKEINLGHLTQARTFLERALRLDPGSIEALYSSAVVDVHTANGYFTDDRSALLRAGERALTKVLSLAPDHAQAHGILGAIYTRTDRVDQGIAELDRALDVEGYSRLMGADEVGTLKGLTERRAILDRIIGEHRAAWLAHKVVPPWAFSPTLLLNFVLLVAVGGAIFCHAISKPKRP